jgi:MFS family permease
MLIGTTLMVVTPGFATIGLAAPIIITVARLLQGFSVGGEFGSAVTFLVEHAGERRGYSASWQWATIGMTSIIASLFGLVLTSQLSHQQLVDWGWRVPYVFGLLVGPAGLYIRSRVAETPSFSMPKNPNRPAFQMARFQHPLVDRGAVAETRPLVRNAVGGAPEIHRAGESANLAEPGNVVASGWRRRFSRLDLPFAALVACRRAAPWTKRRQKRCWRRGSARGRSPGPATRASQAPITINRRTAA